MTACYTIQEAAKLLGIGRNEGYKAARRGEIPTIRIGRRLVVPKARLDAMLGIGVEVGAKPKRKAASARRAVAAASAA